MRNCELENDSFSITFTIPVIPILVQIPPKGATKWPRNWNRDSLRIGIGPPLIGSLAEAGEKTDEEAGGRELCSADQTNSALGYYLGNEEKVNVSSPGIHATTFHQTQKAGIPDRPRLRLP